MATGLVYVTGARVTGCESTAAFVPVVGTVDQPAAWSKCEMVRPFRSRERKFLLAFAPWNFRSLELWLS